MAHRQPNILFIQADQHRYDCISANGHPLLRTPHLDRLGGEGIRFDRAYCPTPVCIPSRNSLAFGVWPTEHLAIANWSTEAPRPAKEGLRSYSETLREGGYWLGHVGKWHVHPERGPQEYGFHSHSAEARAYERWRAEIGLPLRPRSNSWWGELDPHISPGQSRCAFGANRVIELLQGAAAHDRPFFVQWDTDSPHIPNVVPEPFYSMYAPDDIPPWPSFPDPLEGKPYMQAQQRRTWKVEGWTWEQWAPVVRCYLAEVSLIDAQVGRVLDALEELGLAEEAMVVFTSDHGGLCGGHGMIDKHYVMYEDVTHVPLIVRWPGHTTPGARSEAWVCHSLDLAATFCDAAGVPAPDSFCGHSLLPLLDGTGDNGRRRIGVMYQGNQFGLLSVRMIRDERLKYVWNATALDELYDLENDPGELHNLAADPQLSGELTRLRHDLVAWMEEIGDTLLNQWTRTQLLEGLSV